MWFTEKVKWSSFWGKVGPLVQDLCASIGDRRGTGGALSLLDCTSPRKALLQSISHLCSTTCNLAHWSFCLGVMLSSEPKTHTNVLTALCPAQLSTLRWPCLLPPSSWDTLLNTVAPFWSHGLGFAPSLNGPSHPKLPGSPCLASPCGPRTGHKLLLSILSLLSPFTRESST